MIAQGSAPSRSNHLRIELDRAEDRRDGDDPTAVGARRPSPNGDDDDRSTDDERGLRYM